MKAYILVDENNIVRCIASKECNLHKDKSHMSRHYVDIQGSVGDEYKNGKWTAKPENYPKPTKEQLIRQKMSEMQRQEFREKAIAALQEENILDKNENYIGP